MGINRNTLVKLTYFLKERNMRRRDILFHENDVADGLFFIKEGEFEISKSHETVIEKKTLRIQTKLHKK